MAAELGFCVVDLEVDDVEAKAAAVTVRWRKLLLHLWRVRRLQRLFGQVGNFLKASFPASLRDRLRGIYP